MPISFRCSRCQTPIRVPDGTEGKKTQCPSCQEIQSIPTAIVAPLADEPSPSPVSANPYADQPDPFGAPANNPYSSPNLYPSHLSREAARNKLMPPAICVIVAIGLGVMLHALNLILASLDLQGWLEANKIDNEEEQVWFLIGLYGINPLIILFSLVIIAAMTRAIAVRNYGFVLAGFIMGMIPCTAGCGCIPAIAFCIWGIVVLSSPSVSAAFRTS
ncbi:hypothetical protein DTL42_09235 [Bremerella cremea]|uniref:Uncharacterized protein n=1 Tax=Bremerella cremea TaxID=1031537 RepID=A0A368KTM9_9BACT|nr:hypothetical protein [Bremerella cremea]RCS52986.1 hypothetical protein DTL42_09235 [Bremerella cremea]